MPRIAPYSDREISVADFLTGMPVNVAEGDEFCGAFIHVHYDDRLAAIAAADEYFLVGLYAHLPATNDVAPVRHRDGRLRDGDRVGAASSATTPTTPPGSPLGSSSSPPRCSSAGSVDRDIIALALGIPAWELGPEAVTLTQRALVGA